MTEAKRKTASWENRFWAKVNKDGPVCERLGTCCWEWEGYTHKDGHGQFRFDGVLRYAHRVAFVLQHGDLADDVVVRHDCDNAKCVRWAHLRTGTRADNNRDRHERGGYARIRDIRKPKSILIPGLHVPGTVAL